MTPIDGDKLIRLLKDRRGSLNRQRDKCEITEAEYFYGVTVANELIRAVGMMNNEAEQQPDGLFKVYLCPCCGYELIKQKEKKDGD